MRTLLCFFSLLAAGLACRHGVTSQPQSIAADEFRIDLQWGFSNTPVVVFVDQNQVFTDTVWTLPFDPLAAIIPVQVNRGMHSLSVTIPKRVSKDTSFFIYDTLYIGVSYDSAKGLISYIFRRQPFGYR